MSDSLSILGVAPTVFLHRRSNGLEQLVRVQVRNATECACKGELAVAGPSGLRRSQPAEFAPGDSTADLFVPETATACALEFCATSAAGDSAWLTVPWTPPRHWTVHVVQQSHHDLGYTSLPSRVLEEHAAWLDTALEIASDTRRYPDDARFRIVVEQAWSLDHYLRHAARPKITRMIELLRNGRFELTALFGNLTTELCGHETLIRALYPTAQLQREYGFPVISAEHNDIPGFAWGLSEALVGAGVQLFCPGIPLYYNWGAKAYPSFWDEAAVFGRRGTPGAFWWETPSGKRLLFWCGNTGCGGDCRANLPTLADHLRAFEEKGYPFDLTRWPVIGGARDNSPYIADYCETIRTWNRTWAWPHLISSTNARFYTDLTRRTELSALPVHRGDMPGQDYPVGATSTAAATAVNRRNHADFPAAEALATAAALHAAHPYPQSRLTAVAQDIVLHDEHSWGHHFPCGPTAAASDLEKALLAFRAATWAHDATRKAMASLADAVKLDTEDIHLVVFNSLPRERTETVTTPLREIDNAGSDMVPVPAEKDPLGSGYLRGVILNNRWPVHPPPEIVEGRFDLIDTATGSAIPYQIVELDSALGPEPYAAQRLGLGAGGKRYGGMDRPIGLSRSLCFRAGPIPGLGYRTYRLRPRADHPTFSAEVMASACVPQLFPPEGGTTNGDVNPNRAPVCCPAFTRSAAANQPQLVNVTAANAVIENRYWHIELDPASGAVRALRDLASGREWVDAAAPHPFGTVFVREPDGTEHAATCSGVTVVRHGPLTASLRAHFVAPGHPRIESTLTLHADDRKIEFAVCMLKAPNAFLDAYLAFPFALAGGEFTCDTPLCLYAPARDRLAGAYANRITVQNWLRIADNAATVLWSSLDAPVVSLGRLWPPRVSQAHSCVVPPGLADPPQTAAELRGGTVYSCLTANNFGTNFAVSQNGLLQFRYVFTCADGARAADACARFGTAAVTPLQAIFTRHPGPRPLPPVGGALTIDHPAVQVTAFKLAEDSCRNHLAFSAQPAHRKVRPPGSCDTRGGRGSCRAVSPAGPAAAGRDLILRLWNVSDNSAEAHIQLPGVTLQAARLNSLTEEDTGPELPCAGDTATVMIAPRQVVTVRLSLDHEYPIRIVSQ